MQLKKRKLEEKNRKFKGGYNFKAELRDKVAYENSGNSGKPSGNDEIFQVNMKAVKELHRRYHSRKEKGRDKIDELDLLVEIRVDTQYVIWQNGQNVYGHSGALNKFKNPKRNVGGLTEGSQNFHERRFGAALSAKTPQEAAVRGLIEHRNQTIDPNVLDGMNNMTRNTYTTTGHNLKNPTEKKEWLVGYKREDYKTYAITRFIQGSSDGLGRLPSIDDNYTRQVDEQLNRMGSFNGSRQQMKQIGKLLRQPAPYSKNWRPS